MAVKFTRFKCIDNTGVVFSKCIKVYNALEICMPGSIILVSIKKTFTLTKVKKGQIFKGLVVRLLKKHKRLTGLIVKYFSNSIILLKKTDLVPLGTRIYGSVFFELRFMGFVKVVMLSKFLL